MEIILDFRAVAWEGDVAVAHLFAIMLLAATWEAALVAAFSVDLAA